MADQKTAEEIAAEKADAPSEKEPSVTVERLLAESDEILGVRGHIVAGAFEGVDPSKQVSVSAAKKRVESWLKAEDSTNVVEEG